VVKPYLIWFYHSFCTITSEPRNKAAWPSSTKLCELHRLRPSRCHKTVKPGVNQWTVACIYPQVNHPT